MDAARGFETVENRRKDRDETMKLEKLVGERFRERPADCAAESHALMLRGGYMKSVANGIYSSYTPLRRITQKIESILREEMDAIDGQEVLFDRSLENADRLVCGANAEDYHFSGLDMARDVPGAAYRDFAKIPEGGVCPRCGKRAIRIARGIEVGNIFQLGTKYTKAMHMTYVDREGREQYPVMGCYGIGVGRLAAAVCEARHDEHGPVWPVSIAPWQVHLCAVRHDDASVGAYADGLYDALRQAGVEVICDDRPVSAGVMFADADLLGVPLRAVVSPRNMKCGTVEVSARDRSFSEQVPLENAAARIRQLLGAMQAAVRSSAAAAEAE